MPLYEYQCPACERGQTIYCSVSEYRSEVPCECGQKARRILTPLHVMPDIAGYRSVVTGEWIGSRRAHREHLKRHNLVEVGNAKWPKRKPKPMPDIKPDLIPVFNEVMRRGRK